MYKKPKPNQDAVPQILDLEFQSRRAIIDSALKEEDRPTDCQQKSIHVSKIFIM